ncbi:hypothetical protein [Mucilaginibacter terrae]|uniref:DUF4133 domain-containing protein n=1 Tax=Mucilaginibacter terrae TaxID=1955052 RepID=A0ABU3GW53_9SPHI|nr:hypothetical protein [Mucilaginibacter terrae]MDT3404004.1 hypothetical protein [Mucilaginibacter terrae]
MKRAFYDRPYRFIFIPFIAAAFLGLISLAVMQLWNILLPGILHVSAITFWQAMGIFILSKILFGFGRPGRFGGGGAPWMRGRMAERFKNMSPEERSRFKDHFDKRCRGGRGKWSAYDWPEEPHPNPPQEGGL